MTMLLAEFILARLAEDQADAIPCECPCDLSVDGIHAAICPERVFAQCEAIRRIAEDFPKWPTVTFGGAQQWPVHLRHLASIWADHPDYRQEWAA